MLYQSESCITSKQCLTWLLRAVVGPTCLNRPADIGAVTEDGDTALHFACRGGCVDAAASLVGRCPDDVLLARNVAGLNALDEACGFRDAATSLRLVRLLTAGGTSQATRQRSGGTPAVTPLH